MIKIALIIIAIYLAIIVVAMGSAYINQIIKSKDTATTPLSEKAIFGVEEIELLMDIVNGKDTLTPEERDKVAGPLLDTLIIKTGISNIEFLEEYGGQTYSEVVRGLYKKANN